MTTNNPKPSAEPSSGNGSPGLVERLEAATEGSDGLDRAIRDALGLPAMLVPPDGGDEAYPYTRSLDAALTLAKPPGHPLWTYKIDARNDSRESWVFVAITVPSSEFHGRGRTAELAMCAASLRMLSDERIAALKARLGDREIARGLVNGWLPQPVTAKAGVELAAAIEAALDAATERGRRQGWSADEATVERVRDALRQECLAVFDSTWSNRDAERFARAAIAAIPAPPAPEGE